MNVIKNILGEHGYAKKYQKIAQKNKEFKAWHSVGTWNYKDDKDMEQKRLDATKHFGVDTRITKVGNKFDIYAWGEDLELDKKIDWGNRHYK